MPTLWLLGAALVFISTIYGATDGDKTGIVCAWFSVDKRLIGRPVRIYPDGSLQWPAIQH